MIKAFLSGVLVGGLSVALWCYWSSKPVTSPQPVATETVPCKSVQALPSEAKKGLPKSVVRNEDAHVVGIAKTDHKEVTAVLDTGTGVTRMFVSEPFFQGQREIGLAYGYKGSERVAQLEAAEDFIHFRKLGLGVVGQFDTQGKWFLGVRARVSW
jgi:hypothetical protein